METPDVNAANPVSWARHAIEHTLTRGLPVREPTWGYAFREKLRHLTLSRPDLNLSHPAELLKPELKSALSAFGPGWETYQWELYRAAQKWHREQIQKDARYNPSQASWRPKAVTAWPPPPILLPGCLPPPFEHYELITNLADGGQGVLYVAINERYSESLCVIKFFIPTNPDKLREFYKNPDKLPDNLREYDPANLLQQLSPSLNFSHPSIAPTKELLDLRECTGSRREPAMLNETDAVAGPPQSGSVLPSTAIWPKNGPRIACVMNYYPLSLREALGEYQCKHAFAEDQVSTWMNELIAAVNELHLRHGIVHRDVKPANILFEPNKTEAFEGCISLEGARLILGDCSALGSLDKRTDLVVSPIDEYKPDDHYHADQHGQVCKPQMDKCAIREVLLRDLSQLMRGDLKKDRDRLVYRALCNQAKLGQRTNGERRWREVRQVVGSVAQRLFKNRALELIAAVRTKVWQGTPRSVPNVYEWVVKLTIRTACEIIWDNSCRASKTAAPFGGEPVNKANPVGRSQLCLVEWRKRIIMAFKAMRLLTPQQTQRVVALHLAGLPPKQIALLLGIEPMTAMFVLTHFVEIVSATE